MAVAGLILAGCAPDRAERSPEPAAAPRTSTPATATQPPVANEVVFKNGQITSAVLQSWIENPALRRLRLTGSDIDDAALATLADNSKLELIAL